MKVNWQCQATFYAFYLWTISSFPVSAPCLWENSTSSFVVRQQKKSPDWNQQIFKGGKRKKAHAGTEGHVDFWILTFKIYNHSKHTSSVLLTAKTLSLIIKEMDEVQMAACVPSWLLRKLQLWWIWNGSPHPSGIKMGLSLDSFVLRRTQNILPISTLWHGRGLTMKYKRMQSPDCLLFTEVIN